jgi:hypothetical protein
MTLNHRQRWWQPKGAFQANDGGVELRGAIDASLGSQSSR